MYKHIIFDLDHTLWDFDKNSEETLRELIQEYQLNQLYKIDPTDFITTYRKTNKNLWNLYNKNKISKEELRLQRFDIVLERFNIDNPDLVKELDEKYIANCPLKPHLIEGTLELLEYLSRKYKMHILTNGFDATQHKKLKGSKIDHFFDQIITSETLGIQKPDSRIYHHLLKEIGASTSECLMIGDNLYTDILGAQRAKIDQVFFNPLNLNHSFTVNYQVRQLIEIKEFL